MEYQELIKVIREELESSELIARVENDDIPSIDLKKRSLYPLAAFYIDSVEVTSNVNTFTVQLLIADILDVNKQTKITKILSGINQSQLLTIYTTN